MDKSYFLDRLYPLQDEILRQVTEEDTEFCLTDGTAASRGYLHHRFSDDLALFVNDDPRFSLWAERLIHSLTRSQRWGLEVLQKEQRFVRCEVHSQDVSMKIEMVNDVPAHLGGIVMHDVLGRLDSPENILANTVTALVDRDEPNDLADIWGFCCRMGIPLSQALEEAQSKASGVFPADLARPFCSAGADDWSLVRWIEPPSLERFLSDLRELGEKLIL